MTAWTSDELDKIGTVEELEIASLRRDGTLRNIVAAVERPEAKVLPAVEEQIRGLATELKGRK